MTEPLDLDEARAALADNGIDGPDQPYNPRALAAMRTADRLLAEVERLTAENATLRSMSNCLRDHGSVGEHTASVAAENLALAAERDSARLKLAELRQACDELTAERDAERAKVEVLLLGDKTLQPRIWLGEECVRLKAERDEARRERDLAIAHDRQPYPTADAYERACAALKKHRRRADRAEIACLRMHPVVEAAVALVATNPVLMYEDEASTEAYAAQAAAVDVYTAGQVEVPPTPTTDAEIEALPRIDLAVVEVSAAESADYVRGWDAAMAKTCKRAAELVAERDRYRDVVAAAAAWLQSIEMTRTTAEANLAYALGAIPVQERYRLAHDLRRAAGVRAVPLDDLIAQTSATDPVFREAYQRAAQDAASSRADPAAGEATHKPALDAPRAAKGWRPKCCREFARTGIERTDACWALDDEAEAASDA